MVLFIIFFVVFISATSVAGEVLGADKMAPAMALFFYYGYRNEWYAHQGWTTIGGHACRDGSDPCTFDQFLDATTRSGGKGGYKGGQVIDDKIWDAPIKRIADSLQRRGLTGAIDWDPQKLIIGAGSGRNVWDDHIRYVLNAFNEDRARKGHQQNYHNKAIDALTLMAEINAEYVSQDLTKWFKDRGILTETPEAWKDIKLPAEGDPAEGAARTIVDYVNFVKTWVYEANKLNGGNADLINFPIWDSNWGNSDNARLGYQTSRFRQDTHGCRFGPPYPDWKLPEIDTSPVNWPDWNSFPT